MAPPGWAPELDIPLVVLDDAAIAAHLRARAMEVGHVAGAAVAAAARGRAPVLTGRLRDSIGYRVAADGTTEVYAQWYDRFLEMPARQIPVARKTLVDSLAGIPKVL